jgi:hypothetical protein
MKTISRLTGTQSAPRGNATSTSDTFAILPKRLQWDYRLGNVPRLILATDEELMQIPDEVRKCVAFLARKNKQGGYDEKATVFFVFYPLPDGENGTFYAVTAKHVIEKITEHGDGVPYCCLNTRKQGRQFVPIPNNLWVHHEDSHIDVAVAPIPWDWRTVDHTTIPISMFATSKTINEQGIGVGEDLFFPSLFTQRPGEEANLPIIRIGNIAAMPGEPIATSWGVLPQAYLIEARSIGGLSGSPVFWHCGPVRLLAPNRVGMKAVSFFLLGLVHGHYNAEGESWDFDDSSVTDSTKTRSLNTGIAMVIPASDILATMEHPNLQEQRRVVQQGILDEQRRNLPVPDSENT